MKKFLCLMLAFTMLFAATASLAEELSGGWELCDPAEPVPEEARTAFDKAMETLVGVSYEPVCLLEKQLVAGMNYCLLCKASVVAPDAVPYYAVVTVYAALDGSAEILSIQDIDPYPAE